MKTVKVRIAVVVAPDGSWCSAGWGTEDEMLLGAAYEGLESEPGGEAEYWLTAELAIPEAKEVEATVEEAK